MSSHTAECLPRCVQSIESLYVGKFTHVQSEKMHNLYASDFGVKVKRATILLSIEQ